MATIGFQFVIGNPQVRIYPEHTTANSFAIGDLVKLTAGKVVLASDDSALWGVAGKAASGTVDTEIPVYVLNTDQVWMAEVDTTSAQSQVGADYGLNIGTAGSMSIDIADTTTTSVTVLDLFDAASTATGRVLVKFNYDVLSSTKGV